MGTQKIMNLTHILLIRDYNISFGSGTHFLISESLILSLTAFCEDGIESGPLGLQDSSLLMNSTSLGGLNH